MTKLAESTTFDVQKIRADFPILNEVVHGKPLVYLDNANTTQKPQLEIFADDVKCTHGATIGQLDADAMFYLQARGITRGDARSMLIRSFAGDIVARVKFQPLRERLERWLLAAIPADAVK